MSHKQRLKIIIYATRCLRHLCTMSFAPVLLHPKISTIKDLFCTRFECIIVSFVMMKSRIFRYSMRSRVGQACDQFRIITYDEIYYFSRRERPRKTFPAANTLISTKNNRLQNACRNLAFSLQAQKYYFATIDKRSIHQP